jgi:hypothetical protein
LREGLTPIFTDDTDLKAASLGSRQLWKLLVGLPLVGVGLGQADVGQDSVDEVAGHVLGRLRVVVEGGDRGEDGGSGVGGELHVAKMDAIEGGFADAEDQGAVFFEADIGGAVDEVGGEADGYGGEGAHGAGEDDHGGGGIAAAGDVGAYVGFGVLLDFVGWGAEEFFYEVGAAAEMEFFGQDSEGVFADDEIDFGDAIVLHGGAEELGGVDAAAGSGYGEGDVAGLRGFGHGMIIADCGVPPSPYCLRVSRLFSLE